MSNAPCNFQKIYTCNFVCPIYLNKVFILFKVCPCILWMNPIPHAGIPMMPNNILKVKCINKGHLTCGICYVWAWSSSHYNYVFFFIWPRAFFSFRFCLAYGLFKIRAFIELWSCCLGTPWRINGYSDFLVYIRRECVRSKS